MTSEQKISGSTQLYLDQGNRERGQFPQTVRYFDAYDIFGDVMASEDNGWRITGGSTGKTLEGHGGGIRVLCDVNMEPAGIADTLRRIAAYVEREAQMEAERAESAQARQSRIAELEAELSALREPEALPF